MTTLAAWTVRFATVLVSAGVLLVMVLYSPKLEAPFLVPKFAALELTGALGFLAFALARARWDRWAAASAVLVIGTTALSWVVAGTAPYAIDAMARWGALLGVACGASVVADEPDARQRVLESVTLAISAVAVIGLMQHLEVLPISIPVISTPGSTFGNRNFAAEAMAMGLPLGIAALLEARQARGVFIAALGLEVLFLAATRTRGAWAGAAVGLVTMLWLAKVRLSRRLIVIGSVAGLAAVFVAAIPGRFNPRDAADLKRYEGLGEVLGDALDAHSIALRTRLGLWRRTVSMIADHPLLGVGPGNWPLVFPRYAEPGAAADGVLTATLAPRQAHDDVLERTAETGLVGFAALACFALGIVKAARRRARSEDEATRLAAASAVSSLAALVVLSLASFPLEMPGTLVLSGVAVGLCVARPSHPHSVRRGWYAATAAAMVLVVLAGVRADRHVRASRSLLVAERALHRDDPRALAALDQSLRWEPNDERARLTKAQVLVRLGRAPDAVLAARDALALEPFSPYAWDSLAAAELASGDQATAQHDAARALDLLHDYPSASQIGARH